MVGSVDRQICFRLPEAGPAASPVGPFRLGDMQAEALSELLQGFACGEESAALAFAHLGVLLWRMRLAVGLHASQKKS